MDEGFRTFDHTGDLGLEAWAGSPERLYALAVLGVLAQVAEAPGHAPEVEVHLALSAADPGDLLVDLCSAALLEAEVRGAVWTDARVTRVGPQGLEATLSGPRRDPRRQVFLREIKAVSHHDLELDLTPGRCRCRLVLDV
jgi:SHS2 domain-containing protein